MVRLSKLLVGVSLTAATLTLPAMVGATDRGAYIVNEGDTLSGIAIDLGVPLRDLLRANGLTLTSLILPGQRLDVPDTAAGGSSAAASGRFHRVVSGDTLGGIAARYGVSLGSLLTINDLRVTSLITPGMELALPVGASAVRATPTGPTDVAVAFALAQVGKPYQFFTAGSGAFDCSGLTMAAYGRAGISLVHHSATQAQQGSAVDFWNNPIRAGDLIFLDTDWNGVIDHVGMALNATSWVQASQSRDAVVTGPLPAKSVIIAVRRLVPAA